MLRILMIFIFGFAAGAGCMYLLRRNKKVRPLIEAQAEEKAKNKESILGILETQSSLTNNHIEQLLGISDATATRYLDELEKEGKVRQVGKTGRHVYYEKI